MAIPMFQSTCAAHMPDWPPPRSSEYLTRLGVTVNRTHAGAQLRGDDRQLVERGLRNYWGYNSIGFLALEPRYLATGSVREFKTMVKTLHSAGLAGSHSRRRL